VGATHRRSRDISWAVKQWLPETADFLADFDA
jgi:hypothetical protein